MIQGTWLHLDGSIAEKKKINCFYKHMYKMYVANLYTNSIAEKKYNNCFYKHMYKMYVPNLYTNWTVKVINRGYWMCVGSILNLLNKLDKIMLCKPLASKILFYSRSSINSVIKLPK
jgi:hypothetical protein